MKKILYFLFGLPLFINGQTTSQNFIKTTIYKQANTTSVSNPGPSVATVQVTYFDGLGRPIQQVANQQSASGKDIIVPIVYDSYGLKAKNYLPYAKWYGNANMEFVSAAQAETLAYYNSQDPNVSGNPHFDTTTTPYSETQFEASPLNRILKQASPGNDWDLPVSASDPDNTIRLDYQNNTAADQVKLYVGYSTWTLTKGLYDISLTQTGTTNYTANQLYKTIIKNENWKSTDGKNNTTEEYKNKEGKLILKRSYTDYINSSGTLVASQVAHDTYYVYDQFNNLVYIIPPLVTNITTQLDGLCYQYKYDYRNRQVEKKLPGKQWEFVVYDRLNRVIATGPALSPFSDISSSGWMITKYDLYNRPVYTGWQQATSITTSDRKTLQDVQNNLTTALSETKLTTAGTIDGITSYYTNVVAPTTFKLLTINYYDDYNFQAFTPAISYPTTTPAGYNNGTHKPKGLPTGTWIRALTTSTATTGTSGYLLYDYKARPIRVFEQNYLGGYTQVDGNLDFSGNTLYTITAHKHDASSTVLTVREDYSYTAQGRLFSHTHTINGGTAELLSENTYDELGNLISKKVGNTSSAPLQKVDYSYNIRGWLTGINNDSTNNLILNATENDLFAFKINYNTVQNETNYTGTPLYNGNISETYWRSSSDNVLRKYGYQYDSLNRFKNAIYQKPGTSVPVTNMYNESVSYDKNGNISALQRNGDFDAQSGAIQIDNLTYTYANNSNQLTKVDDATNSNASLGFKNGTNTGDDYTYDANGNLLTDQNKGITTNVKYNHLNLPTEIVFSGTTVKKINYLYDALGNKLQKIITNGTVITTTDYLDGFQYLKDGTAALTLQYFPTAEGYVNFSSGVYKYVYNYVDHLGNVRMSYTQDTTQPNGLSIIEENHYYPLGLKHTNYNVAIQKLRGGQVYATTANEYKYKFQGQELQDELGLNWDSFKWRNYDPAIGRFMSIDKLAEKYNWQSNYSFCSNQVVHSREIEGLEAENDLDYNDGDDHGDYLNHTGESNFQPAAFDGGFAPMNGELNNVDVSRHTSDGGRYGEQEGAQDSTDGYSNKSDNYQAFEVTSHAIAITSLLVAIVGVVTLQPELVLLAGEMYESTLYIAGTEAALKAGNDLYTGFTSNDEKKSHDSFVDAFKQGFQFGIELGVGKVIGGSGAEESVKLASDTLADQYMEYIFQTSGGN